jgi:hypothetical protein
MLSTSRLQTCVFLTSVRILLQFLLFSLLSYLLLLMFSFFISLNFFEYCDLTLNSVVVETRNVFVPANTKLIFFIVEPFYLRFLLLFFSFFWFFDLNIVGEVDSKVFLDKFKKFFLLDFGQIFTSFDYLNIHTLKPRHKLFYCP